MVSFSSVTARCSISCIKITFTYTLFASFLLLYISQLSIYIPHFLNSKIVFIISAFKKKKTYIPCDWHCGTAAKPPPAMSYLPDLVPAALLSGLEKEVEDDTSAYSPSTHWETRIKLLASNFNLTLADCGIHLGSESPD